MVQQPRAGSSVLTPRLDDNSRSLDDADSITVLADLVEACHLAEQLARLNRDQRDVVLLAQSSDQLNSRSCLSQILGAVLGQEADVGISAIQSLDRLVDTTGQTIDVASCTDDLLDCSWWVIDDGCGDDAGLLLDFDVDLTATRVSAKLDSEKRGRVGTESIRADEIEITDSAIVKMCSVLEKPSLRAGLNKARANLTTKILVSLGSCKLILGT